MMNRYFLCGSPILNGGHACFLFKQIGKIVDIVDTYFMAILDAGRELPSRSCFALLIRREMR